MHLTVESQEIYDLLGCDTIEINTVGPFDLKSISLSPDSTNFNTILFFDKSKIKTIRKSGLKFYAEFPEASKLQNIRMAILLIILPFLLTWIIFLTKKELKLFRECVNEKFRCCK